MINPSFNNAFHTINSMGRRPVAHHPEHSDADEFAKVVIYLFGTLIIMAVLLGIAYLLW